MNSYSMEAKSLTEWSCHYSHEYKVGSTVLAMKSGGRANWSMLASVSMGRGFYQVGYPIYLTNLV